MLHDIPAQIWIVRHGETEWSLSGQHTGRTDIALTVRGEAQALAVRSMLGETPFGQVLASPLQRAFRSAEIAGFMPTPEPLAMEWNYGKYDGRTSAQIREDVPGWSVWKQGPEGGETAEEVAARAAALIEKHVELGQETLLFSHGHFTRILAATWLGLDPKAGQYFALDTGSLSCLGYEHGRRVLRFWNRLP